MSNIIEKLDMTTILDEFVRDLYNSQASLEAEIPPYEELEAFQRYSLKSTYLPVLRAAVEAAAPHVRRAVEAELVDERFTQAVAGVDIEVPDVGGAW
ncbi:hypothetical protein CLV30_10694 [Haloactinopolyspora alba]|uniref:Uncharacterized protein n=1 Tax=Haloactinopolyspora alba TaxID=648780 RepID=A0A2P8E3Q3_9ACTN|nr:hypothetical protein [Haloactinopolyspora alba]PSL04091.1 hypothetical protein CLV30_10694 [Haloactinopolyspora alba]